MNPPTHSSNRKFLSLLVLVSFALLAGWTVWQARQLAALAAENSDLKKSLAAEQKRAKDDATDANRWRKAADSLLTQAGRPASAAGTDATAASDHKRNLNPEAVAALVNSKGLQSVIASQQSAMIAMTYKDLLDRLKLSPEERDYMQKLLLDRQMVQVTNGMQMMNGSLSPDDRAALGQQIMQGVNDDDAKIHTFLNSDADYATYQSYSGQETERTEIGMFESSLGDGNALDPATADSLASLLSDTRKNFPFTVDFNNKANFGNPAVLNTPTVNKFLDEQVQYQAQVADKAAALLTPAQLQAFKQNQAAMGQMTKMQMSNIVQMSGGGQ
jgi:predicted negative regulator of RcsB-dependent stress response